MSYSHKLFLILVFLTNVFYASHDKYRLTLRSNPATTITIGWNQISGQDATVYYGTSDKGTNYNAYPNAKAPDRSINYKGMNNRFVRLTGLRPNTAYYFVIRDNDSTSDRFWFKTATNDDSRLSFIAGGDSRNNRTPRRNANILVSKLKPNAVFFGGDMTDDDTSSQWRAWFDDWQLTTASDGRMFPIVATRGNHEDSNSTIYNLFDTPSSKVYYALTFGNNILRAYTLNTEISIFGDQTSWLQQDLVANQDVSWRMAQYHKPMRPHVFFKSEGNSQYTNWAQLFYDYKVRLVVECDAHVVKSTWPVRPSSQSGSDEGFIRDNNRGTVYIGEGCWGAPLRGNGDAKNWTRNSASFNQFKWIFVYKTKIEARTIKTDNAFEVGSVSNNNRFSIPSNLDVWRPSNGSVVEINNDNTIVNPGIKTLSIPITSGSDDVEEDKNGDLYVDSSDLELVYDQFNDFSYQKIGLRFATVGVPKGAIITNAFLQFTADESHSDPTNLKVSIENTSNARAFSDAANVSSRTKIAQNSIWNPNSWQKDDRSSAQRTSDVKALVQQVVNKPNWQSGNSMAFIIEGTGKSLTNTNAKRTAESYEGGVSKASVLQISYRTDNPSSNPCNGVAKWSSSINYEVGDRVVFQNILFELGETSWINLENCSSSSNQRKSNDNKVSPPIHRTFPIISIIPNPFSENIKIEGIATISTSTYKIAIHTINGKPVYKKVYEAKKGIDQMEIELATLSSGVYFLSVIDANGSAITTSKFIKR
ncbi:fibronectin type III domain-containing protein [Aquimarina sp. ERC-38]|uniref:fibronectin type III domain-containing protein n=1 Tax=Aquimarina sp. ERC-38 TaxID=2949996 RepID=UPI0022463668|nr:fibronectin type III domain-containing protein [Aquimarina sp. ERC-38]UZO80321.1 fibronectin type III domain-containing protein [Aquimarina sp. ERC-38]